MRPIILSAITGWITRLAAIGFNLVAYPIILRALGQERFGLFLIVSGLASWAAIGNLGLTLVTVRIIGRKITVNPGYAAVVFRHALIVAISLNFLIFFLASAINFVLPWETLLKVSNSGAVEFSFAVVTITGLTALSLVLGIFESLRAAFLQLHILYAFRCFGYLASFAGLFLVLKNWPSLELAVLVTSGGVVMADAVHAIWTILSPVGKTLIRPRIRLRLKIIRCLIGEGFLNVGITVAFVLMYQFSVSVVGFVTSADRVITYGVDIRVLVTILQIQYAVLYPMWTALSNAAGRGQPEQIWAITWKSGVFVAAMALSSAGLIIWAGEEGLRLWLGARLDFGMSERVAFALLTVASLFHQYLLNVLFGLGKLRILARTTLVEAVVGVGCGCVATFAFGPIGMMLSLAVVELAIGVPVFMAHSWPIVAPHRLLLRSETARANGTTFDTPA